MLSFFCLYLVLGIAYLFFVEYNLSKTKTGLSINTLPFEYSITFVFLWPYFLNHYFSQKRSLKRLRKLEEDLKKTPEGREFLLKVKELSKGKNDGN